MMSFRSIRLRCMLAGLALACLVPAAAAQPGGLRTSSDYIAGFVRYVYWPEEDRISAWTVCIDGPLPAGEEQAYAGRTARGKPFVVRRLQADATTDGCRILDLTAADKLLVRQRLLSVRHQPLLTVGSGADFCSAGGHICLHPANAPHGFDLNLSSLQDAGLNVSARLLKLVTADFAALFEAEPGVSKEQRR